MLAATTVAAEPLRVTARPRVAARAAARAPATTALFTKTKPPPATTKKAKPLGKKNANDRGGAKKKMSQGESMKEMSSIVAQAFALGLGVPVGVVALTEASKQLTAGADGAVASGDPGLYSFIAASVGFAGLWGAKSAARDELKRSLLAKGLDVSTVDNISVLKWVKSQDDIGKGKRAIDEIYKAYETEANPWSPFFKPVGAVPDRKKR